MARRRRTHRRRTHRRRTSRGGGQTVAKLGVMAGAITHQLPKASNYGFTPNANMTHEQVMNAGGKYFKAVSDYFKGAPFGAQLMSGYEKLKPLPKAPNLSSYSPNYGTKNEPVSPANDETIKAILKVDEDLQKYDRNLASWYTNYMSSRKEKAANNENNNFNDVNNFEEVAAAGIGPK